jgi:hypothetical protein
MMPCKKATLGQLTLYDLPLEIKQKIYKIAVQSNMIRWRYEHRNNFRNCLEYIEYKALDYLPPVPSPRSIHPTPLCYRELKNRVYEMIDISRLEEIWLNEPDEHEFVYNGYSYSDLFDRWYVNTGKGFVADTHIFWHNLHCRCKRCECVREFRSLRDTLE